MHNQWTYVSGMGIIVVTMVAGVFLSGIGANTRSTSSSSVNRSDVVDQTQASATAGPSATAAATATPGPVRAYATAPALALDPNKQYTATIKTDKGDIVVQLFAKDAPKTVNSFVFLAQHNYFDGLDFDRIVPNFVIQGGDPNGNATGGPGYSTPDEVNSHKNDAGAVAMANAGPGTDGSTFYINLTANPSLNANYTVFGQVTAGMDVVQQIGQTARDPGSNAPATKIESITISSQ